MDFRFLCFRHLEIWRKFFPWLFNTLSNAFFIFFGFLSEFDLYNWEIKKKGSTDASTLAGDEKLGSESMLHTLTRIDSTVWIGLHVSSSRSCSFMGSGRCKIEMQTRPSGYTVERMSKKRKQNQFTIWMPYIRDKFHSWGRVGITCMLRKLL